METELKINVDKTNLKLQLLTMGANELAYRYLSPLYIVGSFLRSPENALDIDIYMLLTEDRFKRLFGGTVFNEKQFRLRKKCKLHMEQYIQDMDIDFKVETPEEFFKDKGKKKKLDTIMEFPE